MSPTTSTIATNLSSSEVVVGVGVVGAGAAAVASVVLEELASQSNTIPTKLALTTVSEVMGAN
jgi:hypothetical protein